MATTITKYIGTGGDYTSITAWDADAPASLIVADEIWIGVIISDIEETVVITSHTTDSTRYRKLTVADENYHYGVKTQGVALNGSIRVNEKYFVLERLRITRPIPAIGSLYVIDCPGFNIARYITIDKCLIHDCAVAGNDGYLFGIRMSSNGGGMISNNIITDLTKPTNTDADFGGQAGIYIGSSSVISNYIYNNTVINISTNATFMKADGGIGVGDNTTIVKNNIVMLRQYVDDASSIPNVAAGYITELEDYRFDYSQYASTTSSHNCEMGSPYTLYTHFLPGAAPNYSLTDIDPWNVFRFPGTSPLTGNGSYGYGFRARGTSFYGLVDNKFLYKVEPHETGIITFNNVYVKEMIAGWLYDGYGPDGYGPLTQLNGDGTPYTDGHYTIKYSGAFSYDRDHRIFTLIDGGDEGLIDLIEMTDDGVIQFKTSSVTTDWTINPLVPNQSSYSRDSYGFVAGYTVGPSNLIVGCVHNLSMQYIITERAFTGVLDLRLKNGSPCNSTGTDLSIYPTLTQDIALVIRENWDMGAFAYVPYVVCRGYIDGYGWHVGENLDPQTTITTAQITFNEDDSYWIFSLDGVVRAYFDPLAPQYYRFLNTVPTGTRQKAEEASIRFDNKAITFFYNNVVVGIIDENGLN